MASVQYRVVGRCPQCASEVVLLDAADRLPAHRTVKGKAVCSFQGDPVRVRRISEPPPARTSTSAPTRKLSRKQAKRAKQRAIRAVVRAGNERLYGPASEPRSTSVKATLSGLPTLGKR